MSWPPLPTGRPYRPWYFAMRLAVGILWILLGVAALSRHDGWWAYLLLLGGIVYIAYGIVELVRYARRSAFR